MKIPKYLLFSAFLSSCCVVQSEQKLQRAETNNRQKIEFNVSRKSKSGLIKFDASIFKNEVSLYSVVIIFERKEGNSFKEVSWVPQLEWEQLRIDIGKPLVLRLKNIKVFDRASIKVINRNGLLVANETYSVL